MSVFDQRRVLEKEIIERALKSNDFRKSLLANPKSTLESEYGVVLPEDIHISVHQEKPNHLHIVLPTAGSGSDTLTVPDLTAESSWHKWGHAASCAAECTQCSNNETSCQPGPTED